MKSNLLWLRRVRTQSIPWLPTALMTAFGLSALVICAWSVAAWRTLHGELEERLTLYNRYRHVAQHQAAIESSVKAFGAYLSTHATDDAAGQQLISFIEQAAQHASVQITGLKPRPSQRTPHAAEYTVELECSASMEQLARFVHALEYGPVLLRVNRLRINPAPRLPAALAAQAGAAQLLDSQLLVTYTTLL